MKFAFHVTLLLFAVSIMVIFVGFSFKRRTIGWIANEFQGYSKETDEKLAPCFKRFD